MAPLYFLKLSQINYGVIFKNEMTNYVKSGADFISTDKVANAIKRSRFLAYSVS